ncbi:hypothetical protein V6N13_103865 [Hibiscus sabdariffa]|uniref:Uncharacterized protein n=2 Tax=Hibiscus sabdariffa TaxID=183260 RepID=A0ABR2NTC7_9ROSI
MAENSVSKVSLKLLVDTKRNKVLLAEAGKDFVDFLFNLLSSPPGIAISLLNTNSTAGSLGNLCGMPIVSPDVGKGVATYMVMDDFSVEPLSALSSFTMLNKFSIKRVGALQERVVHLGMNEGLKLLKVSLQSKSVLTSVFLGNESATSWSVIKEKIFSLGRMLVYLCFFSLLLQVASKDCVGKSLK